MTPHEVVVGPGPYATCITCDEAIGPDDAVVTEEEAGEWAAEHIHVWWHLEHRWVRRCTEHRRCTCGERHGGGER